MLNKENYVPWSSRLLRYAKSRPNGKLIHNSILNGPYVRRMIPKPGSNIGIQEKKDKLFNEWERFTSTDGESIESYYHHYTQFYDFLKYNQKEIDEERAECLGKSHDPLALMATSNYPVFHQNQPSPSTYIQQPLSNKNYNPQPSFNLDFMQQPMPNPEDILDPTTTMNMALALMAKAFKLNYSTPTNNNQRISSNPRKRQIAQPGMNMGQDRQIQMVGGNGGNQFRQFVGNQNGYNAVRNVGNQVVQNAVQKLGVQNVGNQNGIIVVPDKVLQLRRRDVAYRQTQLLIAQKEEAGIQLQAEEFDFMAAVGDLDEIEEVDANCILMANLQQASTSGTQSDKAPVYDSDRSTEVHNYNNYYDNEIFNMFTQEEQYTDLLEPILEQHHVQQDDINVISDVPCVEHDGGTVEQCLATIEETRALYDSLYNNLAIESVYQEQCLTKKINALHLSSGKQITVLNEEISNLNKQLSMEQSTVSSLLEEKKKLKFDFKICEDELLDKQILLENKIKELDNLLVKTDSIYENAKLRAQLFDKVSEHKGKIKGTSVNNLFAKQSILGKPPSSSKPNLHSVTPFPKSSVLLKVDKTNALSKPVTSNSIPTPQESKVVKDVKVIAPGMFRINPSKTSREDKFVPINKRRASVRTNPTTISQPQVIAKKKVNSNSNSLSSTEVNNIAKTRRPQPRRNTKNDRVTSMSKSSRSNNKEIKVEEHHRNLLLSKKMKHMSFECNNAKLAIRNVNLKLFVLCVIQICLWCVDSGCSKHMTGNLKLLINFVWKFLGTIRFENDHVAAILGFDDLQWGNILITKVCFIEGLGHNLFLVGQFCDSDLEVAFKRNTYFVRNLEGVDLLKGNRTTNLYTINLHEMASASPICLIARATSTKSWLWHQRLSYLNFDTINDLARNDLVTGLPKFKYHKEHLCPSCKQGKSKRASHPPKLVSNSKKRLHLLHMDLCGPMRIASINGKRYVLVIIDDFSHYTWVHFLRSKDEALEVIKTFLKLITILLQAPVSIVRTDNGTEFKN
ncbi:retrovirus-related pol polyprotein from transposon TNT 1-94 [Tanacetum coccineum]|uniref:Retrovirus-related pol polyprotein from transposon TNT 1-94 n=1 Tax=Tanacetum coccineum TaxID=301880 RepID=A0ABQ4ZZY9_9ASTR